MKGDKTIYLLQVIGRIPGLGFMEKHANTLLTQQLTMRSHKERALELKERGDDLGEATGMSGKGGKGAKGGAQRPGTRPQQGGRGQGAPTRGGPGGPPTRGNTGPGGPARSGNPRNSEWGPDPTDRGLRRAPPSNLDRRRNPEPEPGRPPEQDRLRRKNYDL